MLVNGEERWQADYRFDVAAGASNVSIAFPAPHVRSDGEPLRRAASGSIRGDVRGRSAAGRDFTAQAPADSSPAFGQHVQVFSATRHHYRRDDRQPHA